MQALVIREQELVILRACQGGDGLPSRKGLLLTRTGGCELEPRGDTGTSGMAASSSITSAEGADAVRSMMRAARRLQLVTLGQSNPEARSMPSMVRSTTRVTLCMTGR